MVERPPLKPSSAAEITSLVPTAVQFHFAGFYQSKLIPLVGSIDDPPYIDVSITIQQYATK